MRVQTGVFALTSALFTLLAGCATSPASTKDAPLVPGDRLIGLQNKPGPDAARAVVVRDTGFLGGGCFYAFWIDGVLGARFNPGEKGEFFIQPGERVLKVGRDPLGKGLCALDSDNWTQRESVFKPNETKTFRLRIGSEGKADIERTE